MKNNRLVFFICMLIAISVLPVTVDSIGNCKKNFVNIKNNNQIYSPLNRNTITVDDDGPADYKYIQDAINASNDGDMIFVYSGRYTENLVVDKGIILTGENKDTTIINSSKNKNIVNVSADNIQINGFNVERSEGYSYYPGIDIQANFTKIFDNIFSTKDIYNFPDGIYITSARNNNQIYENSFIKTGLSISADIEGDNIITDNIVNGNSLVYLDSVSDQSIESAGQIILKDCENISMHNIVIKNTPRSIMVLNSDNCSIEDCIIHSNDIGIDCIDSDYLRIINNDIYDNREGIFISYSEEILISGNDIHINSEAVYIQSSEKINISLNNLYSNGFCLNIFLSDLNIIMKNNFGNNIRNVFSMMCSLNSYMNNFWDRPRFLPKIIIEFPRINFDWRPAKNPFDI
jgi:parallel beta-helix repeat protein